MCDGHVPCINCGSAVQKYLTSGRCSRCYNYKRRTGKERPLSRVANCIDCGREITIGNSLSKGMCRRCNAFLWRTGKHWTPDISIRSKYDPCPICKDCKSRPSYTQNPRPMCRRCSDYWKRTDKRRPRYRDAESCKVCGKPRVEKFCLGRCGACYDYWRRHGRSAERPAERWELSQHGWCDCGKPATHTITFRLREHDEPLPLCDECYAEEQRQARWYGSNYVNKQAPAHAGND